MLYVPLCVNEWSPTQKWLVDDQIDLLVSPFSSGPHHYFLLRTEETNKHPTTWATSATIRSEKNHSPGGDKCIYHHRQPLQQTLLCICVRECGLR